MNWFSTYHTISSSTSIGAAADLKRRLDAVDGLRVVDQGDGKLWLLISETESLNSAPPGSHEFARGFLLFSTMLAVRHELGNKDIWWDECEVVSTDGPRLKPTGKQVQVRHNGHSIGEVEVA